jgi:hypothetical protein
MYVAFLICSRRRDLSSPVAAFATGYDREVSSMTEKVPILVVLGIDIGDKPHASRFEERDAPLVQRAAELMGFHVIRVAADNDELHAIAEGLPLGKIFATGRAFVPFVGQSAFDKLATLVGPVHRVADKVEVGTVVLAAQPDLYGPGWWEAVIVHIDGDDLTLRWMDDPALQPFHIARRDVVLRYRRRLSASSAAATSDVTTPAC